MNSRESRIKLTVIVLATVLAIASSACADHFIKQASHTDAMEMMGQKIPAQNDTISVWVGDGKAVYIGSGNQTFIYSAEDEKYYALDHAAKTYAEIPFDMSETMEDMAAEHEGMDAEQMKQMAQAMMGSSKVTVTPTDETREIGDWDAKKYLVDMNIMMANVKSEMWATEDIEIDYDLLKMVGNPMMAMMPGYKEVLAEMMKIKGVVVYSTSETSMGGGTVKSVVETIEYAEKDPPAGTYDIPEGYKKVDIMQMDMGQ